MSAIQVVNWTWTRLRLYGGALVSYDNGYYTNNFLSAVRNYVINSNVISNYELCRYF